MPDSPGVHFGTDWTVAHVSSCGSQFDYAYLYLLGFRVVALTLVGGGVGTIRESVS